MHSMFGYSTQLPVVAGKADSEAKTSAAALTSRSSRRSRSQKMAAGPQERTYSTQNPITLRLPNHDNGLYRFSDRYIIGTISSSAAGPVFNAYNFQVGALGNVSPLTTMFDQYMIECVEFMTIPYVSSATPAVATNLGRFLTVVDYDDASALGTEQAALDYQNCLVSSGTDGHYRKFEPHVALAAYSGAFTSYANRSKQWIDAASTTVQHYGVKTVWTATDVIYKSDVVVVLHTAWRNVR